MQKGLAAAAIALAAALALTATPPATADGGARARVAVADGVTGRLAIHDLRSGRRLARFTLAEPPYLLTTAPDRRHVLAVEQAAGRLSAFDGGTWVEDHGDHQHAHTRRPRRLPFTLRATKPAHLVPHGDQIALFDDGTGAVSVFGLDSLRAPSPPVRTLTAPRAHHGVAVPLGERTLVTVPADGDGALPAGVSLRDRDGAEQRTFGPCPGLHGEFADRRVVAFGCEDGVLLITTGSAPAATKVRYPPTAEDGAHATTLHGREGGRWLLGNFGDRALVVIDRQRNTARTLRLSRDIEDFVVDRHTGDAFALTVDGRLHELDLRRARPRRAVRAVDAFRVPEDWRKPRPKLAVGAGQVLIADPARHRVVRRDAETLRPRPPLRTGGRPFQMTIIGG